MVINDGALSDENAEIFVRCSFLCCSVEKNPNGSNLSACRWSRPFKRVKNSQFVLGVIYQSHLSSTLSFYVINWVNLSIVVDSLHDRAFVKQRSIRFGILMGCLLCHLTVLLGMKEQQSVERAASLLKKKNNHESVITILSSRHEREEPRGFWLTWIFCHYLF